MLAILISLKHKLLPSGKFNHFPKHQLPGQLKYFKTEREFMWIFSRKQCSESCLEKYTLKYRIFGHAVTILGAQNMSSRNSNKATYTQVLHKYPVVIHVLTLMLGELLNQARDIQLYFSIYSNLSNVSNPGVHNILTSLILLMCFITRGA